MLRHRNQLNHQLITSDAIAYEPKQTSINQLDGELLDPITTVHWWLLNQKISFTNHEKLHHNIDCFMQSYFDSVTVGALWWDERRLERFLHSISTSNVDECSKLSQDLQNAKELKEKSETRNKKRLLESFQWRKMNTKRTRHAKHAFDGFQLISRDLMRIFRRKCERNPWIDSRVEVTALCSMNATKLQLILDVIHLIPIHANCWSENPKQAPCGVIQGPQRSWSVNEISSKPQNRVELRKFLKHMRYTRVSSLKPSSDKSD